MTPHDGDWFSRILGQLKQMQGTCRIVRSRNEIFAIRTESNRGSKSPVSAPRRHQRAGLSVPQANHALPGRCDSPTVTADGDVANPGIVYASSDFFSRRHVQPTNTRGRSPPQLRNDACRAKREHGNLGFIVVQAGRLRARGHIPDHGTAVRARSDPGPVGTESDGSERGGNAALVPENPLFLSHGRVPEAQGAVPIPNRRDAAAI